MKDIHSEKYRQIGLKIAYYRRLRCLTQEELAEEVDIAAGFLSQVEAPNVAKGISFDTLFDIAAALDVAPHKFLIFEED